MTKYTTIAGDMWDGIAYKTLGDEAYTDRLMKLNPQYRRTFVFPAGITLTGLIHKEMKVAFTYFFIEQLGKIVLCNA